MGDILAGWTQSSPPTGTWEELQQALTHLQAPPRDPGKGGSRGQVKDIAQISKKKKKENFMNKVFCRPTQRIIW